MTRRVTAIAIVAIALSSGCVERQAPQAPHAPSRGLVLHADPAPGRSPVDVELELRGGSLRVRPGSSTPLVAGAIHVDDPTLLPHVTTNARGVAVVQDFTPSNAPSDPAPNIAWDLSLGNAPMRLSVHVLGSEQQHIDLGGRSVVAARIYNEGGHLALDWSAENPRVAEQIELWSIGYLEASHLARSGAKRIQVKNVGRTEIDLGDIVASELRIDIDASSGSLDLIVPADTSARADLDPNAGLRIEAEGFRHDNPEAYTLGPSNEAPRLRITGHALNGLVRLRTRNTGKP